MGDLARVVATVSSLVTLPWARWSVMDAVASLSDLEYQERVWIRQELPHEGFEDNLDMNVSALFDDWMVLPTPRDAVGTILVDGPEIDRLQALGESLDTLIDDLKDSPDEDYLRDSRWPIVVERARAALSAMVLEGPIELQQSMPDAP